MSTHLFCSNFKVNGVCPLLHIFDTGIKLDEPAQTRPRKVLARRREINELLAAKQQGRTIVPLELLTGGRYIKLRLAAGRGKRKYDKRETLKKRAMERDGQRALRRA